MGREKQIEDSFIRKLTEQLKYVYRDDIHDRDALVANFRQKFETLNRVKLSDSEFDRLLEEIINPNVFASSKRLRVEIHSSAKTEHRYNTRWSISKIGVRTITR